MEIHWSAGRIHGIPGTTVRMHLRFYDPVLYWDFKRWFSDACYHAQRHSRERREFLDRIASFDHFNRYARAYLGEAYYAQLSDSESDSSGDDRSDGGHSEHEVLEESDAEVNVGVHEVRDGSEATEVAGSDADGGVDGADL